MSKQKSLTALRLGAEFGGPAAVRPMGRRAHAFIAGRASSSDREIPWFARAAGRSRLRRFVTLTARPLGVLLRSRPDDQ